MNYPDDVVKKVAQAIGGGELWKLCTDEACAAILAAGPYIRAQERKAIADWFEGKGGVIPGASAFAPLVSGNNMPCMSGDARDRLLPPTRRRFDDIMTALADAIRARKD